MPKRNPPPITVRNAQRKVRVDVRRMQEFSKRAFPLCLRLRRAAGGELRKLPEVTVVLVSDRRMAALHKKFMDIAGATDVITFHHGEIFVSAATAERNARRFRTSTADEIRLYIVHGLLHLHGFDDTTARKARVMESTQTRIVAAATDALKRHRTPAPV